MTIDRLQLHTNDIEATIHFYAEVLGLEYAGGDELTAIFRAGTTLLVFTGTHAEQHPVYHFAFTLPRNQFHEALALMRTRVGLLTLPDGGTIADFSNWNACAFYFYDNNGNILEYIARYDLANDKEGAFRSNDICCISEIGLVAASVPELARQLSGRYALSVFGKQAPQENFTVMGDDNGLLILVKEDRHWFPTHKAADIFPLSLTFTDEEGQEHMLAYGYH